MHRQFKYRYGLTAGAIRHGRSPSGGKVERPDPRNVRGRLIASRGNRAHPRKHVAKRRYSPDTKLEGSEANGCLLIFGDRIENSRTYSARQEKGRKREKRGSPLFADILFPPKSLLSSFSIRKYRASGYRAQLQCLPLVSSVTEK